MLTSLRTHVRRLIDRLTLPPHVALERVLDAWPRPEGVTVRYVCPGDHGAGSIVVELQAGDERTCIVAAPGDRPAELYELLDGTARWLLGQGGSEARVAVALAEAEFRFVRALEALP